MSFWLKENEIRIEGAKREGNVFGEKINQSEWKAQEIDRGISKDYQRTITQLRVM